MGPRCAHRGASSRREFCAAEATKKDGEARHQGPWAEGSGGLSNGLGTAEEMRLSVAHGKMEKQQQRGLVQRCLNSFIICLFGAILLQ